MLIACEMTVATAADHTPQPNAADEQNVQRDIDRRGQQQIIKRSFAVSERVHDALAGVIKHDCQHAGKIIAEIGDSVRQNLGVGAHPAKDGRRQQNAEDGEENAAQKVHENICVDGALDPCVVACSKVARDGNARAEGQALKEAGHQENQRTR